MIVRVLLSASWLHTLSSIVLSRAYSWLFGQCTLCIGYYRSDILLSINQVRRLYIDRLLAYYLTARCKVGDSLTMSWYSMHCMSISQAMLCYGMVLCVCGWVCVCVYIIIERERICRPTTGVSLAYEPKLQITSPVTYITLGGNSRSSMFMCLGNSVAFLYSCLMLNSSQRRQYEHNTRLLLFGMLVILAYRPTY
jgi:hypothetical protein